MAKILTPAPHLSLLEVEQRYRQERDATLNKHWQIIRLMLKGQKTPLVTESLDFTSGW